jgi:hypothetical protein
MNSRSVVPLIAMIAMIAACTDEDPVPRASPVTASAIPSAAPSPIGVGPEDCYAAGNPRPVDGGLEVKGRTTTPGQPVLALFKTDRIVPGEPITVYWRHPGNGALRLTLVDQAGRITEVTDRRPGRFRGWRGPGEPWVSTLTFDHTGCWRVHTQRRTKQGQIWIRVT